MKLLTTNGCPGKYACLSHRWATEAQALLTTATLSELSREVPDRILSRIFLDAIRIARDLGLRYLWIDSLCIVQDDEGDVQREIARMKDVYMNAYITIAANHLDEHTGSMFGRYADHPVFLDSGEIGAFVRPELRHNTEGPLETRGWIFQERMLSPRILEFCASEVTWRCRTLEECECGGLTGNLYSRPNPLLDKSSVFHGGKLSKHDLWKIWPRLVSQYAKLDLSHEEDRVGAMAGIAQLLQNATGCHYTNGLWTECMERGLFWSIGNPSSLKKPLSELRLPTWAWTAVTPNTVDYSNWTSMNRTVEFEVLSISSDHQQKSLTTLTPASLRLRGRIRRINISIRRVLRDRVLHVNVEGCSVASNLLFMPDHDFSDRYLQETGLVALLGLTGGKQPIDLFLVLTYDVQLDRYIRAGVAWMNLDNVDQGNRFVSWFRSVEAKIITLI